jgi:hypothetical protein
MSFSIREMTGRTAVCRNAGPHRSDGLSSFAHRAIPEYDDRDLRHYGRNRPLGLTIVRAHG